MRSITTRLSTALLLLLCVFWAGDAVAQETTTVSLPNVSAEEGETVQVPVSVDNFTDVGAVTLVINYDPDVVSFTEISDPVRSGFESSVPSPGELRISYFDASASNPINVGTGTLLNLGFTYSGGATALTFNGAASEIADSQANEIDVTFADGRVAGSVATVQVGTVDDAVAGEEVTVPITVNGLEAGLDAELNASQSVANGGVGAGSSPGSGSATLTVNQSEGAITSIDYEITITGLDFVDVVDVDSTESTADDVIGLHIHNAARGETGSVVFGIIGSPSQGGTLNPALTDDGERTIEVDGNTATITGNWDADEATSPNDFAEAILGTAAGEDVPLYLNLHTSGNAGGEIRGQLQADPGSIGAVSLSIDFDEQVLDFGSFTDQTGIDNFLSAGVQNGVLNIGGFDANGVTLDGQIGEASFTYLGGTSALAFTGETEVTDTASNPITVDFINGSVSGAASTIALPNRNVPVEDTISVPVQAENFAPVGALTLVIEFNDAVLDFVGTENGIENFNLSVSNPSAGVLNIAGFSADGVDIGAGLVDLRFAGATAGTSQLSIDVAQSEIVSPTSVPFNVTYQSGVISVTDAFILGDVQGNGMVDAGDAGLILRQRVDLVEFSDRQRRAADVNGSGAVESADASLILQFVAEIITEFPAESATAASTTSSSAGTLELGEATQVGSSDTYQIPVRATGLSGSVTAADLSFTYDTSKFSIEGVDASLPNGWSVVHNDKQGQGELKIALAGTRSITPGTLVTLNVASRTGSAPTLSGQGRLNAQPTQKLSIEAATPEAVTLSSSRPNPFRTNATIQYTLPENMSVNIEVFNVLGQRVATLVDEKQSAGTYDVQFNAAGLSSGTYIYRLRAGDVTKTGRMTLVK